MNLSAIKVAVIIVAIVAVAGLLLLLLDEPPSGGEIAETPEEAVVAPVAWERAGPTGVETPEPRFTKPNDEAVLMQLESLRSRDWNVGDTVELEIPQAGYSLVDAIDEISTRGDNIVTLKSYPDAEGYDHVLITLGERNTLVSLFTEQGEFELRGDTKVGWLVPSRSLPDIDSGGIETPSPVAVGDGLSRMERGS